MKNRLVSLGVDALLIAVMLLWVVGVDYMPVMKVLGLPLFIGAFALWVNWSNTFSKLSEWMDAGMRGEFNE
jgi:uncharacterized membrane protein YvlD (DUF360 family)